MTTVKFTKMHGLGNDYIYFDCIENANLISDPVNVAKKLSDRNFGIGGDGIVLILPDNLADFRMRMFNADGSEAEMCGNAIRCIAKYLADNAYFEDNVVRIATGAGILIITIDRDESGNFVKAKVDMGEPILKGSDIPTTFNKDTVIDELVKLQDGSEYTVTCVSMGNPHAVIFTNKITDQQVFTAGPQLEKHQAFPKKINVEFVKVISPQEVEMRVWERGSGETMACGTGASAVCVACMLNNFTDSKITVHLNGGDLEVEWAENNHVYMTGPATTVFSGTVDI